MKRTTQQNRALHKFCELLAKELNNAGLDMRATLKPGVDIPWDAHTIKRDLWKPIQRAMLDKESTTELERTEVNDVYSVLSRHLGERFGVHVPFPSDEREAA